MRYGIAILLLCSTLVAQVPLDDSNKEGIVEIFAVNSDGVPVHGNITYSVRPLQGEEKTSEVAVGAKSRLKYGTYQLTVRGSTAYPVDKVITVRDRYQVVPVGLFLAPIELPWTGNIVRGKLPNASIERGCTLVRLISLVSENEYRDAKALASGGFTLENVKPGTYMLITFGRQGICDMARVGVVDKPVQELVLVQTEVERALSVSE